jgi:hypothetical protein
MASGTSQLKTCFISAPVDTELGGLRAALAAHGFRVLVPQELTVGADWASEIQKQLARADLVIGVLPAERHSPWVLFELGQASALGRRIVLIISPKAEPIPFSLHQFVVLRIDVTNTEAIEFALDQLMSAPEPAKERRTQPKSTHGLGSKADGLIATFERSLATGSWTAVQQVVGEALRTSGIDVVSDPASRDTGVDFAVWSDVLEPFVGNPLLIEVKRSLTSKEAAAHAFKQLTSYMDASGSRWALLLYGEGPKDEIESERTVPNVLVLSIRALLEGLRTQSFPELVRDLRNRRVHGTAS